MPKHISVFNDILLVCYRQNQKKVICPQKLLLFGGILRIDIFNCSSGIQTMRKQELSAFLQKGHIHPHALHCVVVIRAELPACGIHFVPEFPPDRYIYIVFF